MLDLAVTAVLALAVACADQTRSPGPGPEPEPGPDRSPAPAQVADLRLEADVTIMEADPVQLEGALRVENPTDRTIRFDVGGCPVFLRLYGPDGTDPVWDQGDEAVCTMILRTVTLAPGGAETFRTATVSATDILGEDLLDGTYRVAVYLALVSGSRPEAPAGDVQLAAPR